VDGSNADWSIGLFLYMGSIPEGFRILSWPKIISMQDTRMRTLDTNGNSFTVNLGSGWEALWAKDLCPILGPERLERKLLNLSQCLLSCKISWRCWINGAFKGKNMVAVRVNSLNAVYLFNNVVEYCLSTRYRGLTARLQTRITPSTSSTNTIIVVWLVTVWLICR
jgi:hypothetical protein